MVNWFDLPPEVKQTIFSMVPEVDSIIYVPRDRRRKVDVQYLDAHHFHNLLLVSKTFITPDEFAFAILSSAKLTFYSVNEIRRLTAEVPSSFKESIRRIHLVRDYIMVYHLYRNCYRDVFDGFSAIEKTLSVHMPQLRQVFVSWPAYCAQIAVSRVVEGEAVTNDDHWSRVAKYVLRADPDQDPPEGRLSRTNSLSHVAASFLGNRSTKTQGYNWIRPLPWLRRLILCSESTSFEVILQITICIAYIFPVGSVQAPDEGDIVHQSCWSTNNWYRPRTSHWQFHLDAEMSTRDYMLRCEYEGEKYAYHQKLAHDLLHAGTSRDLQHWLNILRSSGQSPNLNYPSAF